MVPCMMTGLIMHRQLRRPRAAGSTRNAILAAEATSQRAHLPEKSPTGLIFRFRRCDRGGKYPRCPFRKFLASFLNLALVRSRRIEFSLITSWSWAEPSTSFVLLSARLAERRSTDQRCPRIGPTVGMSMSLVVVVEIRQQALLEIRHRVEVASLQEPSRQDAEP